MKRSELFASMEALIEAKRPGPDDLVYLERRGGEYDWWIVPTDGAPGVLSHGPASGRPEPDTWMSFSSPFWAVWPVDPERLRVFFDDLLAELESMAAPADRCRWPVDQPWTRPSHIH